jgi:TolB-like protein
MSFIGELKRRNVFRVAIAYAVVSWLLLQVIATIVPILELPGWVAKLTLIILALGFIPTLIFAWAFELTPDGVKKESEVDRTQSIRPQTGRKLDRIIIAFLLLALGYFAYEKFATATPVIPANAGIQPAGAEVGSEPVSPVGPETGTALPAEKGPDPLSDSIKSIAVLPFRDMSAAGDQAYFGEGIAEELLNALVKLDGLEVASRTSSFSIAAENLDVPAIAERLHVDHILEGSVRTSGQQVRVTAQLIDVNNDVHLWSETYNGTLDDIFEIQDEITVKIVAALKVQLGEQTLTASAEKLTSNPEAYRLYLEGRHLWRQRNGAALQQAIELFKRAVALDPQFHQAWSNLGLAYDNLPTYDLAFDLAESYELGVAAADRALSIFPQSAEALMVKGDFLEVMKCQLVDAAAEYRKALASAPEDPTAHHWYGMLLANTGHTREALEEIQTARRLDPLISGLTGFEARLQAVLGNYDQARELHREAAAQGLYDGSPFETGLDYLLSGDVETARPLLAQGRYPHDAQHMAMIDSLVAALDDPQEWGAFENTLGTAQRGSESAAEAPVDLLTAMGSAYVFEFQAGLDCPVSNLFYWSDAFREQRKTPEFFELMQRAGVVEYWKKFGWPDDCASLDQDLAECEKP